MTTLSLALLGSPTIALGGAPVAGFEYAKVRALLVFLAVERERSHPRDALAELLWPDQEPQVGRNSLRQALAKLRQTIGDQSASPPFLLITRETLQFNPACQFALDAAEFETLLATAERHKHTGAVCPECLSLWERAVSLYRGPFLDGAIPRDSVGFEEWAALRRERYERQARATLAALAGAYEATGDTEAALRHARRVLELDAWDETHHRQVMRLLATSGQRHGALAHYAHARRLLAEDLGVEPEPETVALYEQIRAEATPAAQPSANPAGGSALPRQPTPFVGRDSELAELGELLAEPNCRLITLLGPGGIGKSRLALRAAELLGPIFAGGARWVPLAGLSAPDQLVGAIARAVGAPTDDRDDLRRQLVAFLATSELLLVLDNFEHLTDGAELLGELLAEAPGLKLLVSSRERLRLQWEWVFDLRGLPYPARPGEDAARFGAVQLFLERARRQRRLAEPSPEEQRAIVRICQLAEGMPLALELAAGASREQSFAAISAALASSLDVLQSEFRDQPERHRSVRAAFAYSWRMLPPPERTAMMGLAVFRGSFTTEAATAVTGASPAQLEALADRSLVRRAEDGRWSVHELLRQFAGEKLAEAGDPAPTYGRHLIYFASHAEHTAPLLRGSDQVRWLDELEHDHDNVRAALGWGFGAGAYEDAGRLAGALWRFWWLRGHTREGRAWLEQSDAQAERLTPATQALVLNGLGALVEEHADFAKAAGHYERSLALYRSLENGDGISSAVNNLGSALYKLSEFPRAAACFRESAELSRAEGDRYGEAISLHNLAGVILDSGGDIAEARALLEQCLETWDALELDHARAITHSSLGQIALIQGRPQEAASFFTQSAALQREQGDLRSLSQSLTGLGRAQHRSGDNPSARATYAEAITLREQIGDKLGIAECCEGLGEVALSENAPERTLRLYGAAATIRAAIGAQVLPVDQAAYDTTLAAARAALPAERSEAAWLAGQALDTEAAVAEALGNK